MATRETRRTPKRSRPRPKRTGLLAPKTTTIDLKIDRDLKRRWLQAMQTIKAAQREGASASDRQYESVGEILEHDPPLYLAGGYANRRAFIREILKDSERNVRRLVRVAKYASPQEETRYGISKLDAALDWLEAKAGKPRGRIPVDFPRLRVPTEEGTISFEEATVDQLRTATRKARRKPRTQSPPIVRALRAALPKSCKSITLSVSGGKLTVGNIDPAQLALVGNCLARTKLPTG
jgi:hypothetical protein